MTERILAKQKLQENEKRIRAIFNTVQAGILILDAETKHIVDLNPAAAQMIGSPRENIIGRLSRGRWAMSYYRFETGNR